MRVEILTPDRLPNTKLSCQTTNLICFGVSEKDPDWGEKGVQRQSATTTMKTPERGGLQRWTWLSPPATYHNGTMGWKWNTT